MVVKMLNAADHRRRRVIGALLSSTGSLNKLAELLPGKWEDRLKPYLYILPAVAAIALYLIYPAIQTIIYSFANAAEHASSSGFENYTKLLSSRSEFRTRCSTPCCGSIVAPLAAVLLGLLVAMLADRLSPRGEKTAKTHHLPADGDQRGRRRARSGGSSTPYAARGPAPDRHPERHRHRASAATRSPGCRAAPFHLNSLLLIVMFLWAQVGFSMVLLSAAVKGVPTDTLEAARIDGANERQIFFRVVVPQIMAHGRSPSTSRCTIGVMKLFDIVYVMTNGNFNTNVLATEFFNQLFTNFNNGSRRPSS